MEKWRPETVHKMLRNEKYMGDALLQKTYTTDFLTKKKVVNNGIAPQYYVENSHEAHHSEGHLYEGAGRDGSQGKTLTYNGKAQTGVAAGTGYTLSGTTAATNAGSYKATATLDEGYAWSDGSSDPKTISWKINKKAITPAVTLSAKAYIYNGKVRKPTVTVKNGSTKLAASQYDVTYASGRKNVGTYKVTVKMKGNYSGSKTVSFKINPKGATLSSVTKAKKAATVKWKKQSAKMSKSRITGYQIQMATNSKFTKNKKTVNVKGYSKVSRKVNGLKGGKKYYVHIRTYKKVGSVMYYSPWSKAKTVTTGK